MSDKTNNLSTKNQVRYRMNTGSSSRAVKADSCLKTIRRIRSPKGQVALVQYNTDFKTIGKQSVYDEKDDIYDCNESAFDLLVKVNRNRYFVPKDIDNKLEKGRDRKYTFREDIDRDNLTPRAKRRLKKRQNHAYYIKHRIWWRTRYNYTDHLRITLDELLKNMEKQEQIYKDFIIEAKKGVYWGSWWEANKLNYAV